MAKWDESKHPRKPAGTPEGGEFTALHGTSTARIGNSRVIKPQSLKAREPMAWFTTDPVIAKSFADSAAYYDKERGIKGSKPLIVQVKLPNSWKSDINHKQDSTTFVSYKPVRFKRLK